MPVICMRQVRKDYGKNTIFSGANFEIKPGEIVGLIGKNGAGKTTLFKILLGLVAYQEGEVSHQLDLEKDVGFLLEIALFDYLNAREHLMVVGRYNGMRYTEEEIDVVLERVGLLASKYKKIKTFSFGMKQRLRLATALIKSSKLLILDEPLVGLDPQGIREVLAILREQAAQGVAILLSSHQLAELSALFDRYYYLKDHQLYQGRIEGQGYEVVINNRIQQVTDMTALLALLDQRSPNDQVTAIRPLGLAANQEVFDHD